MSTHRKSMSAQAQARRQRALDRLDASYEHVIAKDPKDKARLDAERAVLQARLSRSVAA